MNLLASATDGGLFKLGAWGTGGGLGTMGFSKLAEISNPWDVFDKVVFRIGATAAATSSILMVVLLVYRILKARKNSSGTEQPD